MPLMTLNLDAMSEALDSSLNDITGVEFEWTKYIHDILLRKGELPTDPQFEDLANDIISELMLSFGRDNGLTRQIAQLKADFAGDADVLLNKVKPVIYTAIDYRRRTWRADHKMSIGENPIPEFYEAAAPSVEVGSELDVETLKTLIAHELSHRENTGLVHELAERILPDRFDGLTVGEICEKHGIRKGGTLQRALDEIYASVASVAKRLGESWMINFVTK